jgi:hypothetical protein
METVEYVPEAPRQVAAIIANTQNENPLRSDIAKL